MPHLAFLVSQGDLVRISNSLADIAKSCVKPCFMCVMLDIWRLLWFDRTTSKNLLSNAIVLSERPPLHRALTKRLALINSLTAIPVNVIPSQEGSGSLIWVAVGWYSRVQFQGRYVT